MKLKTSLRVILVISGALIMIAVLYLSLLSHRYTVLNKDDYVVFDNWTKKTIVLNPYEKVKPRSGSSLFNGLKYFAEHLDIKTWIKSLAPDKGKSMNFDTPVMRLFHKSLLENPHFLGIPSDFDKFIKVFEDPRKSRSFYYSVQASPYVLFLPNNYEDYLKYLQRPITRNQKIIYPLSDPWGYLQFDGDKYLNNIENRKRTIEKTSNGNVSINDLLREFNTRDSLHNGSNETAEMPVNEIINFYDPALSTLQYNYSIWLDAENQRFFNNINLFETASVKKINYLNSTINHLKLSKDTVRLYLRDLVGTLSVYGEKLASTMKDNNRREEFKKKWREYQDGVTEVMNYDMEGINRYLNVFIFLRDNRSKYNVENAELSFLNDSTLSEYKRLLSLARSKKRLADQGTIRTKAATTYLDAMKIVNGK